MSDFYAERLFKARKHHRCCNCRWLVSPAAEYWRIVGFSDGSFFNIKMCSDCYNLCRALPKICGSDYSEVPLEGIFEELWDAGVLVSREDKNGGRLPPEIDEEYSDQLEMVVVGNQWRIRLK